MGTNELNPTIESIGQLTADTLLKPDNRVGFGPRLGFYIVSQAQGKGMNLAQPQDRFVGIVATQDVRGVTPLRWMPMTPHWFVEIATMPPRGNFRPDSLWGF
jgi:hypothetical protein